MAMQTTHGAAPLHKGWASKKISIRRVMRPRRDLPKTTATLLSVAGATGVVSIWLALSLSGAVPEFFLPSPIAVAQRLYLMFLSEGFLWDVIASSIRIAGGFGAAAVLAVPLGILIGNFRPVQSLFEPLIAAFRYMPASAFLPLLVICFGIDELQKWAIVFLGVFFPLVLMVADAAAAVSRDLINASYTLGATSRQLFFRVLLPASAPAIVDNLRISIGLAWTYLIVAEIVGASRGIGIMILRGQRFLETEKVVAGIIVIGILGVVTDVLFRWLHRRLFRYV